MLVMVNELKGKKPTDISAAVLGDIKRLGRFVSSSLTLPVKADVLISSDLRLTQKDLQKLASQSRWLFVSFKNINKSATDECINRVTNSLQAFHVRGSANLCNDILQFCYRLRRLSKMGVPLLRYKLNCR
jgi:hypothetical protein